ncbi:MAG: TlpA disulfide reductase family protein [Xanthomonadales bacterium]|nr:TlpA disulfide reductase family protein [Xanthomonadales bacterium]
MTMTKNWAGAILLAAGLLASGVGASAELRNFQATDVFGAKLDLNELDGQWLVVNYWATWCKPCRKEIPDLSSLHDDRSDVFLVGLAFEEIEVEAIREFLETYRASYPIVLVDVYEPPAQYGVPRVLPTTILISPEGERQRTFVGPVTREMIEQEIAEAMSGASAGTP